MSFQNIPLELQQLPNWFCWRLEKRDTGKDTKTPYQATPNGHKASVTEPTHWTTFENVLQAPFSCTNAVEADSPINSTGFSGIGFVFTRASGYVGIDLDDTHGDKEAHNRQLKIYSEFDSYTELSPSGKGVHIIVKGSIPQGRRRAGIELYGDGRYFTMTGNVINNKPIAERQELLDMLFKQMGGAANTYSVVEDKEQRIDDDEVLKIATSANNGEKFTQLYAGNWQMFYASQSEADLALINIVCFYSRNKIQIKRIFRASMLGQRDKAKRDDYLDYMIEKSFDNMLPPVDIEGLNIANKVNGVTAEPGGTTATPNTGEREASAGAAAMSHSPNGNVNGFPPGLLGEVAQFFLEQAPRPVPEIALAGAIAYLAGLTGRAYNVSGTGLNQYILMLAQTGVGKDAVSDGVSKLTAAVQAQVPSIIDFKGPGELVSSAGLIKWLANKPCVLSIVGEFGKKMQEMASHNANAHLTGLSRVLLQMYSKSGHGSVFDPMAYSDKDKNTNFLYSPSLSIFGESVPDNFYDALDESLISDGLLPRFLIFEYKGERAYINKQASSIQPSFSLVQDICNLAAACLGNGRSQKVNNVATNPDAMARIDAFDKHTTDLMNSGEGEVYRHLWNRAHLKAHKLAALRAVGMNYLAPVITLEEVDWAINLVVDQTKKLISKFDTGQIGQAGGGENKQLSQMVRTIAQFIHCPHEKYAVYGGSYEMHRDGVFTETHLSRRLIAVACFRNDRQGATNAIKRTLKILLDADDIKEIPKTQMQATYGKAPRAFAISSPKLFELR